MGLINLEPTLHDGEEVAWRAPAARCLKQRTSPGMLLATNEAIVFMPNRLNRRRDLVSLRVPWEKIGRLDTAPPEVSLAARKNGGLKRRVRITIDGDPTELFVVNHPEQVAIELRKLRVGGEQD